MSRSFSVENGKGRNKHLTFWIQTDEGAKYSNRSRLAGDWIGGK